MGLSWVSHSTLIYTSELILCSHICVYSVTRHNIHRTNHRLLTARWHVFQECSIVAAAYFSCYKSNLSSPATLYFWKSKNFIVEFSRTGRAIEKGYLSCHGKFWKTEFWNPRKINPSPEKSRKFISQKGRRVKSRCRITCMCACSKHRFFPWKREKKTRKRFVKISFYKREHQNNFLKALPSLCLLKSCSLWRKTRYMYLKTLLSRVYSAKLTEEVTP